MEEIVQAISQEYPCRRKFTEELFRYYGEDEESFVNSTFVFGAKSTGKTSVLRKFLSMLKNTKFCHISATECYSNKILFESIVNGLVDHKLSNDNNYGPYTKIDGMHEFLDALSKLDQECSYIVVIENAEKLRDMAHNILPIFVKLQEYTGLNISCIFVTNLVFEKFHPNSELSVVVKINVPDYSKTDLIKIYLNEYDQFKDSIKQQIRLSANETELAHQIEIVESLDAEFYENYLNIFLNVFYKACRDLKELRFLSRKCFHTYYAPVLSGEFKKTDVSNLWRNINKTLKFSLNTIYTRIVNQNNQELVRSGEMPQMEVDEQQMERIDKQHTMKEFAQTLELPFYAKYLIIAGFLASHNEAKSDKRLFMKHHGKEKKRLQKMRAQSKVTEKLNIQIGPKSFTIDRLLAIFYAILDEKVGLTCNLLAQISTLVHLNFLTFSSGENNIMDGTSHLQCTVGLDFAISIGKLVGFNVKQYLTDFN